MDDGSPVVGAILALLAAVYMTVPVWSRDLEGAFASPVRLALIAGAAAIVCMLVTAVSPRTAYLGSAGWGTGAVVGTVSVLVTAQWAWLWPMLIHFTVSRAVFIGVRERRRQAAVAAWASAVRSEQRRQKQRREHGHLPGSQRQ